MTHLGRAEDCVLTGGLSHSIFGLTHAGKPRPYEQGLGLPLDGQLKPHTPFKYRREGGVWTLAESSPKFSYTFQTQVRKAAHQLTREGKQTALSVIY